MSERVNGTVKWFNRVKGYGFITYADGADVFVHYSAIRGEGYRNLYEGDQVEFTIQDTDKGPQAADVMKLEAEGGEAAPAEGGEAAPAEGGEAAPAEAQEIVP